MKLLLMVLMLLITTLLSFPALGVGKVTHHFRYGSIFIDTAVKKLGVQQSPSDLMRNVMSINVGEKYGGISTKGSDAIVPAEICPRKNNLICFHSDAFNFAVPRGFPNGIRTWKSGKFTYHVFGAPYEIAILGSKLKVWLIKADDPSNANREFQYIYSPLRGLIAFSRLNKGGGICGSMKILLSRRGYAAQQTNGARLD